MVEIPKAVTTPVGMSLPPKSAASTFCTSSLNVTRHVSVVAVVNSVVGFCRVIDRMVGGVVSTGADGPTEVPDTVALMGDPP